MPVCFPLRAAPVSESKLGGTILIHVVADRAFLAVDNERGEDFTAVTHECSELAPAIECALGGQRVA